ncbi:TonB-dependent receptor [Flavihumibacter sp. R14]|nr:TonB-dependent receptor [Flavihumibacter soli]
MIIRAGQAIMLILLPALAFSSSFKNEESAARRTGFSFNLSFQTAQLSIRGKVSDEAGLALPGVTILEKGTTNGTVTDAMGNYQLTVGNEQAALVFNLLGYTSREVAVSGQTVINVVMAEESKTLSEVVVVGYGTQKKKDLTGSVSSISMKDVRSLPVPDAGQAIQGRASGVQVLSSGAPGSNSAIRIRGISTIGNSDPLLVIDGVPTDVPLNTINPDDIATIDILKDASASAIYGSRGASGVILITTKRGDSAKGHLDFKAFTGMQNATNMVDMLNSSQFATLHNEMMTNNGQALNPAYADPASLSNTNWLNEYFRNASIQNYSLAYSGGSENSKYYVSGTYLNQEGIVINNSYKRYTVQFNSDSKPFSWLKFGNNLTLNHDNKASGSINIRNAMAALPGQPIFNADGSWAGPVGQSSWYGDIRNPIGEATINDNTTTGYNILGNINAEIGILPQLKFKTTGGVQASFWDSRSWSPKYNWQPIAQPFSTLNQQSNKSITWLFDNYLTYEATFNAKHNLTVLGGTSAQDNRYDQVNASKANFISDGAQQLDNGTTLPTAGGNASDWALLSFIGRANYSYSDKYLITATVRRDGSSRFGENNRWGWFPSGSVKWRISSENFFKENTWVSDLALRAGFGITGNQNIGNYAYASRLSTNQYVFNGQIVNTVVPTVLPNPDVRWEEVQQSNIGLDAGFKNGRINLSVDAYLKNTTGMLVPMSVPITTGYSDVFVPEINAGKVRNKGVEITLSTQNLSGNFDWNTSFNASYNKNEVISLNGDVPLYGGSVVNQNTNIQKNGFPIGAFYGVITNGIFQTQEEVNNYAIQQQGADENNATSIGDLKFLDLNNDGRINDADRTYLGNPSPRFIFAMNNTFAWRGIDLSVFLQGVEGNDIFNANRIFQEGMSVAQNQTTAVLNRWTPDNTSAQIPRAVFNDPNKNTRPSSRFIEDGSYLRIKNITLGYTLPKLLVSKAGISTARIYLSGQNLFTFTNYTGFDPEVSVNGIDMSVYPVSRTISAGINLNF